MGRFTDESVNGIVIGEINLYRGKLFSKKNGKQCSGNLFASTESELRKAADELIAKSKKEFLERGEPKYAGYFESLWKEMHGQGFELRIYEN